MTATCQLIFHMKFEMNEIHLQLQGRNRMAELVRDYCIVLIEILCCKIFFDTFCETGEGKQRKTWLVPIVLSILVFGVACMFGQHIVVKEVLIIGITTLLMFWNNGESIKRNLTLAAIFQSILLIVDYIMLVLDAKYFQEIDHGAYVFQLLFVVMAKAMLFLVVLIIKKIFYKRGMEYLSDTQWLQFLFFPIFTICMLIALISNSSFIVNEKQIELIFIISIGMVGMNFVMFFLISDVALREKRLHEKECLEIQAENQWQLYKKMTEDIKKQREIMHECKNNIVCIQSLFERKQFEALSLYLEEISEHIVHGMDSIYTNHPVLDALLNTKYQEAVSKDIMMICKINDLSKVYISSKDLVVLVSNVLNNAIEACEKLETNRMIKVKLMLEKGKFIFSVRNTYDGEMVYQNGKLQTTKITDKKNHGIGINNIKKVIERNNGFYHMNADGQEFFWSVIIPQSSVDNVSGIC